MCLLYLPSTKDCLNFGTGTKSLYISHGVTNYYGTEIEISAGFGPFRSTERKVWADYEQLLTAFFFHVFIDKKHLFFKILYRPH